MTTSPFNPTLCGASSRCAFIGFVSDVSFSGVTFLNVDDDDNDEWQFDDLIYKTETIIEATVEDEETVAVPEPGTLALFDLGLVGLGLARRKKAA